MDDITPALLAEIQKTFGAKVKASNKLKRLLETVKSGKATYLDANDFAIELGDLLAQTFGELITPDKLPDGKMYFNIANRILNSTLKKNYKSVIGYTNIVQSGLNRAANIHLKNQVPRLNQNRIDGFINKISTAEKFEDVTWVLQDPIVNFTQSVVDDAIDVNANFQTKAGLNPMITRKVFGHGCDWCRNLAGTYDYRDKPVDIYRRHQRCRCTVEYNPGDGRRQNVWSKKWGKGR